MPILSPVLRSLALLMALCTLPLAAQQPQPAAQAQLPTTTEQLDGVVVSSVDGSPIARVLVTSGDQRYAAFTDSQGRFSFHLRRTISASSPSNSTVYVTLSVRKPGFVPNSFNLPFSATQPDTPEPPLTFKMTPCGVITGHVYPDRGDLPEPLFISLLHKQINNGRASWLPLNGTGVNAQGEFRFADLTPGDYKLMIPANAPKGEGTATRSATAVGYLPTYYPSGAQLDSAAILTVDPGATVSADLTLRAATFYSVSIPVAGLPTRGNVEATLLSGLAGLHLQSANQVVEGYLPDGDYDVLLESIEQPTPAAPIPKVSSALVKFTVSGKPLRTPPAGLHAAPEIPVIVRREFTSTQLQPARPANQPTIYFFLQNVRQDLGLPAPGLKPSIGDEGLSLGGVIPGTFMVTASSRDGYIASLTSGTTDLLREPLQILPDSLPRPIEVTLRDDYATLDVTVTGDPAALQQAVAAQAAVICIPLDRPLAQLGFGFVQQNHATVKNLAPGRYLLLVAPVAEFQYKEYENPDVLRTLMEKGTTVTLAPNQDATAQVPLLQEGDR